MQIRRRTAYENEEEIPGSHVMQYGNVEELSKEFLFTFMGTNHGNNKSQSGVIGYDPSPSPFPAPTPSPSIFKTTAYNQRDAELLHFQLKVLSIFTLKHKITRFSKKTVLFIISLDMYMIDSKL